MQIARFSTRQVNGLPSGGPVLTYFLELGEDIVMLSGGPYPPVDPSGGWQDVNINPRADELRSVLQTMISTLETR